MNAISSQTTHESCPVCASAIRPWRTKRVQGQDYRIDSCHRCGYAFVNPRPSLAFLTEFYGSFGHGQDIGSMEAAPTLQSVMLAEAEDPNSTVDAKRILATASSLVASGSSLRFLDVGCGYGFFSKEAMARGFRVSALELASNERQIAEEMTGLQPVATTFEAFESTPSSLTVVLMSQILEHAQDVDAWVAKVHGMLEDDGLFVIALPNFSSVFRRILQEREPYICPPAHLNFFSARSLSALLERHGFKVEKIEWVSRVRRQGIARRLPKFLKPAMPALALASQTSMKVVDAIGLGMMVTAYARKNQVASH